jgi:eukaryotic-like serine/threonine-protein kinase
VDRRKILGRYELSEPVAAGGMGTLWAAQDLAVGREVAVKLIRSSASTAAERTDAERRFRREARITARLAHPGVPSLYDFGMDDSELFIVMEWVDGVTLANLIDLVDPVPVGWAAAIMAQVCAVLAAAHDQGIIHRDLTPRNVMVCPDGTVKVLDFGLAGALSTDEYSQITRTGETPGSAFYMAPEVAAGQAATPASDLYSVGCLLFELLTGNVVFGGLDAVAEIQAHATEHPPSVQALRPDVPTRMEALVTTLLAKEGPERPASARLVYQSLLPYVRPLSPLPEIVTETGSPTAGAMYAIVQARMSGSVS